MIIRSLFLALSLWLAVAPAAAHAPGRGPNGGQMQDLAGGHIELLAQGNEIVVYLFDAEDRPIPAEQAKATATVLAGGRQEVVSLQAEEGHVLRGRGDFTAVPGMKVVLALTLPGQRQQLGRYAPMD
jgi:hypothetical protein